MKKVIVVLVSLALMVFGVAFALPTAVIPVTGLPASEAPNAVAPVNLPAPIEPYEAFVTRVMDGTPTVRGVYVDGLFALDVVQQSFGGPGYVDANVGTATQFEYASYFDVIGLLAHNYLSGAEFFKLTLGTQIKVVYGNGYVQTYVVDEIQHYQAINSQDSRSPLVDLFTGVVLDASSVFQRHYMGNHKVTFQTCIEHAGDPYWGRAFISASPLVEPAPAMATQ